MTVEFASVAVVFGIGATVGAAYFGGLWITVQRAVHSSAPSLLVGASWLLRTVALLAAFWFVTKCELALTIAFLCGLMLARAFILHTIGLPGQHIERGAH